MTTLASPAIIPMLQPWHKEYEMLATNWLAAGATAITLWQGDHLLADWPRGAALVITLGTPATSAEVAAEDGTQLRLCVHGLHSPSVAMRLQADAMLLTSLTKLNAEVDGLAEALGETEDQLLAFYELTKPGADRLDANQLLADLVKQAARLVKASAAFAVIGPNQVMKSPATFASDEALLALFSRVEASGHELLVRAAEIWPQRNEPGSIFVVPMRLHDEPQVVAVLGFWLQRSATQLSPDLKLARSIAEQGSAQLEIALLHHRLITQTRLQTEMTLARQVQLGLLPRFAPSVPGLDVYGATRPALHVGGDVYDFYTSPTGAEQAQFMFTVGDVSGKGISAALLMAMTRTTIRGAWAHLQKHTPADVMASVNADLYDDFTEVGMMATVFIGQYDPANRLLTYANAGHSPVIYCPHGGEARLLEADGPVIGALPFSLSQNQTLSLQPHDVLVIASDGFNEARRAGLQGNDEDQTDAEMVDAEMFGIERLLHTIEELAVYSASEIAEQLFATVASFAAGHPQDDDQTLIVIKAV